jgi:cyclopropane fatty-acyl-phospholipid synthase-like methyltransferase
MPSDPFFDSVYTRAGDYNGHEVRPEFEAFLRSIPPGGRCLDLGCGQGRQALPAARLGLHVHAVDYSEVAVRQLQALAGEEGLPIEAERADVRDFRPAPRRYDAIFMVSFLSHLPEAAARRVATDCFDWLADGGQVYVEAFTTADPAYTHASQESETAPALVQFFPPGTLRPLFRRFAISDYREFVEDDFTHGPAHQHGVALLIGRRPREADHR